MNGLSCPFPFDWLRANGKRFECRIKPPQRALRIMQMRIGIIQRTAIMRAQDKETHHLGIVLLEPLADSEKVAERLGHFLFVHIHEAVVHPVIHILPTTSLIIPRRGYADGCPAATL